MDDKPKWIRINKLNTTKSNNMIVLLDFYFFLNRNAHFMTGTLFFSRRLVIIGDQAIN